MEIRTDSPEIEHAREINLRMLARNYPAEAFIQFPDKPFHKLARSYGLTEDDFLATNDRSFEDDSHPYIHVDMSRCINCYRCVCICDELPGQTVWQIMDRGQRTQIVPNSRTVLAESSCISCGACVETCPTGALEDKFLIERGDPTHWTKTVCPYCGTGCEMEVGVRSDRIVQIMPSPKAPVNKGHLCVKGRYAFDYIDAADRATTPMIRHDDEWKRVSWEEAFEFIAGRLNAIINEHGKESIGVLGSSRATNEENYLAQKFTRVVLGTNNVDCCARVCHTPTAVAMKMMLGAGAATNSYDDIEMAHTIMVCGANATECHPIIGERIKQAARRGANLIVIDPRKIELTRYADIHLQVGTGKNILLLNSLAAAIIDEGLIDQSFIADRISGFDKFREFIADYAPERVAKECGVDAETIRAAARVYASQKPSMLFHGLGVTEHLQGTEGVMCVVNLALLTGNIGIRGSGVNPLRGQNNVQGAAHMGCDPGILTGSIAVQDGAENFERIWQASVPTAKGLHLMQMMDAAEKGTLKALWAVGYDVFFTNANANTTEKGMRSLDLLIVQDMFVNETAKRFAHVFLPAASSFEKDGTFMNAERRVQRVRKAVEPRGESKSDWEIICGVASAMGKGSHFEFRSAEEIWNEVRVVWPDAAGITYDRLEAAGLQWGCPDTDHPGTQVLHKDSFTFGKQTELRQIKFRPTKEVTTAEFPLLMNSGRNIYQFNAGTMTQRTLNTKLFSTDFLYISESDAEALELTDDEKIRLISRYGEAILPIRISDRVSHGELFATFHDTRVFLNRVTSPHRDRFVQSPEFKVTAVRIEKLS
jgi:formate dehydrogenase major subunit